MKTDFNQNKYYIEENFSAECFGSKDTELLKTFNAKLDEIEQNNSSFYISFAKQLEFLFENSPIYANPHCLFAERILIEPSFEQRRTALLKKNIREIPFERAELFEKAEKNCFVWAGPDVGHNAPDWERLLNLGICGLIDDCNLNMNTKTVGKEQTDFYNGCLIALRGIQKLCLRFAEKVGNDDENARFMSANFTAISKRVPETMAEALQLILIFYFVVTFVEGTQIRTLGKIDELLLPYYKHDIKNGKTKEELQSILTHFVYYLACAKVVTNVPMGLSCKTDSGDINPLSMMFLDIQQEIKSPDIKFHIHWNDNTPKEFIDKILAMVRLGNNSFVFCNDKIVISALEKIGIEKADANNYVMAGCYEPITMGKEIGATCSGMVSLPKALELALNEGYDMLTGELIGAKTPPVSEFKDISQLFEAVKTQLEFGVTLSKQRMIYLESEIFKISKASPLFSSLMRECVESGKEAYCGGVKYPNVSVVLCCYADFADSLSVIDYLCFERREYTLSEFKKILQNNWDGNEELRLKCLSYSRKYGNNIADVDKYAVEAAHFCSGIINGEPNGYGGVFRMGGFSIDWRIMMGEVTAASANGRLAYKPLSKNLTPGTGQDRQGVTAALLSAAAFDHTEFPNGNVIDIMIHPTAVEGDSGLLIMRSLIEGYFKNGGMAIHINCLDVETLIKAQKNPEDYQNLQVRLCGWNVRFVYLNKAEQDFLISQAGGKIE